MVARFLAAGQGEQIVWVQGWGYWLIWIIMSRIDKRLDEATCLLDMRNSTGIWIFSDYQWPLLSWPLVKENKYSGYEVGVIG